MNILERDDHVTRTLRRRDPQAQPPPGRRLDHDPIDFFQCLEPTLNLPCLGGLVAEAFDEALHLCDLAVLRGLPGEELGAPLLALSEITIVAALVERAASAFELEHSRDMSAKKGAVV